MKKGIVLLALVGLISGMVVVPAVASLVPMSWGFPQMSQSTSLTAFQKDTALATDNEASAISFGNTASGLCGTAFGSSFPTISQTGVQSNLLSSVKFQNENANFAYAYPFLSLGGSWLPSMGFL